MLTQFLALPTTLPVLTLAIVNVWPILQIAIRPLIQTDHTITALMDKFRLTHEITSLSFIFAFRQSLKPSEIRGLKREPIGSQCPMT